MQRFVTIWKFLPDWMYFGVSADGKIFKKDLSIIHDFTQKVRYSSKVESKGSFVLMNRYKFRINCWSKVPNLP